MSILNSTRLGWLFGLAIVVGLAPVSSTAEVAPIVRQRLLKNSRPSFVKSCEAWSVAASESWLKVEEVGNLNCMRKHRLPQAAQRLVKHEFVKTCVDDLLTRLSNEIAKHPKQLRDYDLPDVQGEEMLAMYARSLYPSYQRYCADGPTPATGPVDNEKGEIAL